MHNHTQHYNNNNRNINHSETHHEIHRIGGGANSQTKNRVTAQSRSSSVSSSAYNGGGNNNNADNGPNNFDKVLLTPQDQYIHTLPKVIITASASVSDGSGKKLNYSVGNVIGPNVKLPPLTYDEYREDDVGLDPFFLDVPKIAPRRIRRSVKVRGGIRIGPIGTGFVLKKKKRKISLRLH